MQLAMKSLKVSVRREMLLETELAVGTGRKLAIVRANKLGPSGAQTDYCEIEILPQPYFARTASIITER